MTSTGALYDHVAKWLSHLQLTTPPFRTLEIGSGSGQYAALFQEKSYVSIDVPETWYTLQRAPDVYASADTLPFKETTFSHIFNVAAFDYFPNPEKCLTEFNRVLRANGKVIIFNYNLKTLEQIHQNCKALADQNRASIGHHTFDYQKLKKMASAAGFSCKQLPLYPDRNLIRDCKLLIRPSNFRNYLLEKQ